MRTITPFGAPVRIRVVETRTWTYEPNLDSDYYLQEHVESIEEALDLDKQELIDKKVSLEELADEPDTVVHTWSIDD
jgi:hypothetical protein